MSDLQTELETGMSNLLSEAMEDGATYREVIGAITTILSLAIACIPADQHPKIEAALKKMIPEIMEKAARAARKTAS
jgi:hypothetical protein